MADQLFLPLSVPVKIQNKNLILQKTLLRVTDETGNLTSPVWPPMTTSPPWLKHLKYRNSIFVKCHLTNPSRLRIFAKIILQHIEGR
ncbi:hypothetical protein [Desulfobotulus mexicanus]|uniref:Uncharacterized protein n=1 Tax=Desulfobotulus mexicanus TaxID=2586642 RepID=A0A5Q4VE47_9BACT|nr:hypothetical protein [Desulfobotulus mexicanus]TYT74677.1 hypothetical protein FIM25_08800 [Desulfobotulus mexicanus]